MQAVEVNLPGGMPMDGQWCRSAWLLPVTGREEEFLLTEGKQLTAAARVTQLIASCLHRFGPVAPVGAELVRQLSVGDREALLLHLRRLTLGERVSCLLLCPGCGNKMDLDLEIRELLVPPYPHRDQTHATEIADGENSYRVTFRVPNGADQEAVGAVAEQSVDAAAEFVMRRCIEQIVPGVQENSGALPAVVLRELPSKMATLDPQAELLLDLKCPECAIEFVAPFDAADYICRELAMDEKGFYREVHALSWHYHWTEEAILGLSRRKRQIYLDLLADDLTRGGRNA